MALVCWDTSLLWRLRVNLMLKRPVVSYPPELRERAMRLVAEVRRAQVDAGQRAGVSSAEAAELKRLRAEVRRLRTANEILWTASAFFAAAELDRRLS